MATSLIWTPYDRHLYKMYTYKHGDHLLDGHLMTDTSLRWTLT